MSTGIARRLAVQGANQQQIIIRPQSDPRAIDVNTEQRYPGVAGVDRKTVRK